MVPDDPDRPKFLSAYRQLVRNKIRETVSRVWAERVIAFVQFWELVFRGFMANRCPMRATALAYTTLLALIPMLAVVASVSTTLLKSQGKERIDNAVEFLVAQIIPKLKGSSTNSVDHSTSNVDEEEAAVAGLAVEPEQSRSTNQLTFSDESKQLAAAELEKNKEAIVNVINNSLQKIQSGSLGVTGMIGLIVVAILLFVTIETTFNDIWGVRHGRSWVARIVQYWATVTLGPLIPFAVLSLGIGSQLKVDEGIWFNRFITEDFLPLLILSLGFSFFYQLMPNTRVKWGAAFIGGISAGCLWHVNSYLYALFFSRSANFTNIYGPLAVVPIFLVGLYISWLILLFGAQVAYAFQNRVAYLQEREAQQINFLGRQYLALRIMTLLGQQFSNPAGKPLSINEISQFLRVSTRLVDEILKAVGAGGLVTETVGDEMGFTLARPLEKISCHDILTAMRTATGSMATSSNDYAKQVVDDLFKRIIDAERTVSETTSLGSIVEKVGNVPTAQQEQSAGAAPSEQPA